MTNHSPKFDALPKRIAPNCTLKHSQLVEFQRSLLSLSSTEARVEAIHESEIERILPEFIMNSDEIGLGGSNSQRMKNVNVIVSNNQKAGLPLHDLQLISHISSLVKITTALTMLLRRSIIIRESEHLGRSKCPYYDKTHANSTSAAFIDRNILKPLFQKLFSVVQSVIQALYHKNSEQTSIKN